MIGGTWDEMKMQGPSWDLERQFPLLRGQPCNPLLMGWCNFQGTEDLTLGHTWYLAADEQKGQPNNSTEAAVGRQPRWAHPSWPCPDQPGFLCRSQNTMSHRKLRNVCFCCKSKNNMDCFKLTWEMDALWWQHPAEAYLFIFSCSIWTLCGMLETDCIFGMTQHFQPSFCDRI